MSENPLVFNAMPLVLPSPAATITASRAQPVK